MFVGDSGTPGDDVGPPAGVGEEGGVTVEVGGGAGEVAARVSTSTFIPWAQ